MVDATWSRLREIWRSMHKRCENPRCKDFPHYGARGIKVCEEWMTFEGFYEWAVSNGYRNDLTLDRVCNKKGYNPGNCRWVSRKAQANNRTTATFYTVNGHTKSLASWCRIYDIPAHVVIHRLDAGWDVETAITKPRRVRAKKD